MEINPPMTEKVHQVEFLLEGDLFPPTLGKLQVSNTLILEQTWNPNIDSHPTGQQESYSIAYVGVKGDPKPHFMLQASSYLDFFLLIYSFTATTPVIKFMGIGTEIPDLRALGTHRVSFPDVKKITYDKEYPESKFSQPILSAKKSFPRTSEG